MKFRVWAPVAAAVDVVLGASRIAMQAGEDGWWQVDAAVSKSALSGGYRFSLDGGDPMPDPRSRWQPDGVHGASHVVDAASLRPAPPPPFQQQPLGRAVIYEMHVGTFTPEGTYAAAAAKLPHLKGLGITHLELLPIAAFPGRHGWGYDGVFLYAPLPAYGTPQALAAFIDACHALDLAVLLDVVYNHLGPDGNYLGKFGPYFTDRVKTGWGDAVNYDGPHSDEVRRFIIDNALMWMGEYGFDGLRLDAVHAIFSFEAVHVLQDLNLAVRNLEKTSHRKFLLIAESDLNDPRLVLPAARGGYGLDAHWEDDFHHALHRFFADDPSGYYEDFHGLSDIATALREGYVYQGQHSVHRKRRHGRPPAGLGADQLIVCSQNHDQIGNRAQGERLSMLVSPAKLQAIAALTLLSPFVPMLFQGEEWGASTPFLYFTDHQDPELGRLVAEGRAREFRAFQWQGEVPNPQAVATFERSKLDWSEVAQPEHARLLEWYRRLIALRLRRSAAGTGTRRARVTVKFNEERAWLRLAVNGVLVACNFSPVERRIPLPAGRWLPVLDSATMDMAGEPHISGSLDRIPPHGTRVFELQPPAP